MGENAGRAGLAKEAFAQALLLLGAAGGTERDGFDGDRAADIGVDGMVDHTHGTPSQLPNDFVSPDAIHSV